MNGEVQAEGDGRDKIGMHAKRLGNYYLWRLLGSGRTGEVYLAEQVERGTAAAVKVFWLHLMNEERQIFLDAMQGIAAFQHPHVTRILEYGIVGDMPYLAMTYAPRGTLSSLLPPGQPQPLERILPYVEQIADALHNAHERVLLHLDLQPRNLLLGENYELLLSGIGLALPILEVCSSSKLDIVGNVLYLAPEQLRGQVGPACDQYALGIMVYEWLCGQCPFQGTFIEVGKQHLHSPVPSLRAKVPSLSTEVEQVVLQALAKNPGERFESVKAFAHALERSCQPQTFPTSRVPSIPEVLPMPAIPITPEIPSTPEIPTIAEIPTTMGDPIAPRDPQGVSLLYTVAAQARPDVQPQSASVLVAAQQGQQPLVTRAGMDALSERVTLPTLGAISYEVVPMPGVQNVNYVPAPAVAVPSVSVQSEPIPAQLATGAYGDVAVPSVPMQAGAGAGGWNGGNQVQAFNRPSALHGGTSAGLATRPPSAYVNTHLPPRPDMYEQRFSRRTVVLGLLGLLGLAAAGGGAAWYLMQPRVPAMGSLFYTYIGHANQVLAVEWSPASRATTSAGAATPTPRIASGSLDETVQVWDALTGDHALTYKGHTAGVEAIGWSPDGKLLASGSVDRTVQVWNAGTGQRLLTYSGHRDGVLTLAWSPDGKYIASAGKDATVQVWDVHKGHRLLTYSHHKDWIGSVAWSPDGKYIASASADRTVQVWDAHKGHLLLTYPGHKDKVWAVAWAGDSKHLASGGDDKTVQVWSAITGHPLYVYHGHSNPVETVAWSPDGKRVASGGEDKTVQVWDAVDGRSANPFTYIGHLGTVWSVAWSPDGSTIASASLDHTVQVWQAI